MTSSTSLLSVEKQAVSKQEDAQTKPLGKKTGTEPPLFVAKQPISKQDNALSSKMAAAGTPSPAEKETVSEQQEVTPLNQSITESQNKKKEPVSKQEESERETLAKMAATQYPFPLNKESFPEEKEVENEEDESPEARAEAHEDRWRFEFDMVKDPQTGKIPPLAAAKALEAALRAPAYQKSSGLSTRNQANVKIEGRGPNNLGGRTRALAFDKRNPQIMIAGGISGGAFRSTDGGANWTRVSPLGEMQSVTAIAQDPRTGKEDTWYYGSGEEAEGNSARADGAPYLGYGIWKSEDNGVTWKVLPSTRGGYLEVQDDYGDNVHRLVVDPTNGNVYAAAAVSVQCSKNGGTSWNPVVGNIFSTIPKYSDIIVTPQGRLYAALHGDEDNNGVWTSTTGEKGSWERIAGTGAATSPVGWKAKGQYGRIVLAYAPSDPNIVYALYDNKEKGNCIAHADLFRWDLSWHE